MALRRAARWAALGFLVAAFAVSALLRQVLVPEEATGSPVLEFEASSGDGEGLGVVLRGLPREQVEELSRWEDEAWRQAFPVYTLAESQRSTEAPVPMLGTWQVEKETRAAVFRPRFPFEPGLPYVARWQGSGDAPLEIQFSLPPEAGGVQPRVTAIYPTAEVLPANLLRFYVHFSAPMRQGEAMERVRLLTGDGEEVPSPFVPVPQELWNPAGDRLTLFLDPGRIKRQVGPNLEAGAPLEEGREYRLWIDPAWQDVQGQPLGGSAEKRFRTESPDRDSPRPEDWHLRPPTAPEDPLDITFEAPLDQALALRLIRLEDPKGDPVLGEPFLAAGEMSWTFRPREHWSPGEYAVVVDPALEDPSGNSLRRPFETPPGPQAPAPPPTRLSFEVSG